MKIENLPDTWTIAKLEDLLDYIQPTNFIVNSTDYDDTYKTPVLTAGKSFILGHTNETEGIFNNLPTIIFDDFTTAIKFVTFPFKVKSSAMKILVPTNKIINLKFVYYFMETLRMNVDTHKRYWISVGSKIEIPFPPINEQNRIVEKIEQVFSELDNILKILEDLTGVYYYLPSTSGKIGLMRQSILKKAFEGKLVEQDLNDEPASILLERIKTEKEQLLPAKSKTKASKKIKKNTIKKEKV
jgi:type I restriction enzyme S subunit